MLLLITVGLITDNFC